MNTVLCFGWSRVSALSALAALAALAACGGVASVPDDGAGNSGGPLGPGGQPEVVAPTRALAAGDCHSAVTGKAPDVLFAPYIPTTPSFPSPNSLVVSGERVYAALRGASDGPYVAPVSIYVGGTTADSAFQPFTTIEEKQFNFEGGPVLGAHHVYWWQQVGSEWTINPSHLAYRDADGTTHDVAGTDIGYGASSVVDGDEVFALTCADDRPDNTGCMGPTSRFTLFDARLDTGTRSWSKELPITNAQLRAPMAVDDHWVYWTAPPVNADMSKPSRLMRVARAGGDIQEVAAGLVAGESITALLVDGGALDVFILAAGALGAKTRALAFASIGADGTARPRVSLGATSTTPLVAIDQSSVYFTTDDGVSWPDTARTLSRACRDGSNIVAVVRGFADGSASRTAISDLAIDGHRIYFTSANQVLALDK